MESVNSQAKAASLTVCTAMAAALLAGCAGHAPVASTGNMPVAAGQFALSGADSSSAADIAVAKAERRVAKAPRDGRARLDLAQAYLLNGRFASAATTFEDAGILGRSGADIALAQALAYIGSGQNSRALATLNTHRDEIPASDYGLAIALAGQTSQGVAILTDAVRAGDATPKSRQNLAFAYALDGRWAASRVVALQDLPADQIDARMSEWARMSRPGDYQTRVAGLLAAPVRGDPGQPVALALAGREPVRRAEVEAPAPLASSEPGGELPALASAAPIPAAPEPVVVPAPAVAAPVKVAMAAPDQAPKVPLAPSEDISRQALLADRKTVAVAETQALRFRSEPVIQPIPKSGAKARKAVADVERRPLPAGDVGPASSAGRASASAKGAGHRVQLGSFRTLEGARRSLAIYKARNPDLAHHDLAITEAMVGGHRYYRVAAEGFDRVGAGSFCSRVHGQGEGCLAYDEARPLPGGIPGVLFAQAAGDAIDASSAHSAGAPAKGREETLAVADMRAR